MAPANIPSCCLTTEQKDALIDAVRQRPVIWDYSLDAYQEVQNRRAAFAEVAALLSDEKQTYTGPEMQVEWKKLRDIFNRTLKRVVSAGGGADSEVTWRYWPKLQFIADHERSQIFKAMQKWSKKVVGTQQSKRRSRHPRAASCSTSSGDAAGDSASSSLSMVQQLAAVAHNARQMLKDDKLVDSEQNGQIKVEEEEEEREEEQNGNHDGEDEGVEEQEPVPGDGAGTSIGDALGQILLLSSQMAENGGSGPFDGNNNDASGASSSSIEPAAESDFPMRLLNELLMKGGSNGTVARVVKESPATNGGPPVAKRPLPSSNGRRSQPPATMAAPMPPPPPQKRARWTAAASEQAATTASGGELVNGTASRRQQQPENGGGGDQFDVFGMFVASQVRQLALRSAPSALRLKRALTDLCFQFEAEQHQNGNGKLGKLYLQPHHS